MKSALAAGVVVAERYRLDVKLGEGAMGAVWSATHIHTRRRVALKFLKGASAEARQRFLREARAAAAARHANVVEVFDLIALDDSLVMVMEHLDGETLGARVATLGKLAVGEVAWIFSAIVDALEAVHALGIVHRDLKPENVFLELGADEQTPRVKLLDFGVAKLTAKEGSAAESQGASLTNTESFLGTPYYMSPEQVFGERDVDARADVWSLGVMAYECLSGERPTQAENVGQVMKRITTGELMPLARTAPDVPADIAALVGSMLRRERSSRATLAEVGRVLAKHRGDPPTVTRASGGASGERSEATSAEPVVLGSFRQRTSRIGAIVLGVGAIFVAWSVARRDPPPPISAIGSDARAEEPVVVPSPAQPAVDAASRVEVASASSPATNPVVPPTAPRRSRALDAGSTSVAPSASHVPSYDDIHSL